MLCSGVVRVMFGCCSVKGLFCEQHPNKGKAEAEQKHKKTRITFCSNAGFFM